MRSKTSNIYPNVELGKNVIIEEFCIIGKPPVGKNKRKQKTIIGSNSILRPGTVIYAGTKIGENFHAGHNVFIREDNVIGDNVSIGTMTVLEFGNRIGDFVRIHSGCFLEGVTLESHIFIGPNVVFTDDPHPPFCPKYKECLGGATVKRKARIGANATILPGVVIGEDTLVGAGSVVTKDVSAGTVVVGNPAHPIKKVRDLKCYPGYFERPYVWWKV